LENFDQALGIGFRRAHVLDRYDSREEFAHLAAIQRVIEFLMHAPREDSERAAPRKPPERGPRQEPFFARDISAAIRTPIKLHEFTLHLVVLELAAPFLYPCRGELPIVIESATIFPPVQLGVRGAPAGEKLHGLQHGAMK